MLGLVTLLIAPVRYSIVSLIGLSVILSMLAGYAAFLFVSFLLYALIYGRLPGLDRPDFVVVYNSGLLGDRVPPLLASRLGKGAELYRAASQHQPVRLLVSGEKASASWSLRRRRWRVTCKIQAFGRMRYYARNSRSRSARTCDFPARS